MKQMIQRSYYTNTVAEFLEDDRTNILGQLSLQHSHSLEDLQKNAWLAQIDILKDQLEVNLDAKVYFEFAIPRMGKRVDNVILINDFILVIEFKVGEQKYPKYALEQVLDYAVDLQNFHEGSHDKKIIPILICTDAKDMGFELKESKGIHLPVKLNKQMISKFLTYISSLRVGAKIDSKMWEQSIYKPTPTIIEAAQALYKGHGVEEISRSDAKAINLSQTTDCLNRIIEDSKELSKKYICFVTGVPGAGKTLAGLNIANARMKIDEEEHAVFLSGNGPLVEVLREALTRDEVSTNKEVGIKITKKEAAIKSNAFIQNIHHFRDDNIQSTAPPIEKVVVFDEAQRAWTKKQVSSFMARKKGILDFDKSEPDFLIEVMDRHESWCTIVCLIGGGQEINTGEAGLEEWINAVKDKFPDWEIYYPKQIVDHSDYMTTPVLKDWLIANGKSELDLHLSASMRSFRSEKVADFIQSLLQLNVSKAQTLIEEIHPNSPIYLTRDLRLAKQWLREQQKGSERIGLIASSGARRLRSLGIEVKNKLTASNWFLNGKEDIRSSHFLEEVATEFDIQGLEIDWACLAWGGDFFIDENRTWNYRTFKGTKWQKVNKEIDKKYLLNKYRVLLTRARQGMVIFVPEGAESDQTRKSIYYDHTFQYLKEIGIQEL